MGSVKFTTTFTDSGSLALVLGGLTTVPVPPGELASLRSAANGLLDIPCVVYRKTRTPDGYLSATESLTPVAAVMCGMSQPTAGQLQNYDFLIGSLAAWQIKFPFGTNVGTQDHLSIAGQTLVVQVVLAPRSFASLLTVLASEVK